MIKFGSAISIVIMLTVPSAAQGCAILDLHCFFGGGNLGKTIEKSAHDSGNAIEKTGHYIGKTGTRGNSGPGGAGFESAPIGGSSNATPLTPVREYLRAADIPPRDAGAYGLVVFQSKPTDANRTKLKMVCKSFQAFFPRGETSGVPIQDQMITVWPLDNPKAEKAISDDCDFVLDHYDLVASESAMNDARKQNASFDGEGPYLVGWSPSNSRGLPDKLVLVVDMSADNTQEAIDHKFLFWKNKIVENPSLWRSGWSLERVRMAIKEFADQYGNDIMNAIKIVGGKNS
jgi:hypothetical protein